MGVHELERPLAGLLRLGRVLERTLDDRGQRDGIGDARAVLADEPGDRVPEAQAMVDATAVVVGLETDDRAAGRGELEADR